MPAAYFDLNRRAVLFEEFGQSLFPAAAEPVEQGVELRRMVVVNRMAELVEQYEISKRVGQGHKVQRQVYVSFCRTAAPFAAQSLYPHFPVAEPVQPCERFYPLRQKGSG